MKCVPRLFAYVSEQEKWRLTNQQAQIEGKILSNISTSVQEMHYIVLLNRSTKRELIATFYR